jgi:hypothetical protein
MTTKGSKYSIVIKSSQIQLFRGMYLRGVLTRAGLFLSSQLRDLYPRPLSARPQRARIRTEDSLNNFKDARV